MTHRATKFASLAFVTILITVVPCALAQTPRPFSADMQITGGKEGPMTGKIFYGGQRFRMEMTAAGNETVLITDAAKKITYMIMPQQQMYMEWPHGSMMSQQAPDMTPYDASNPCASEEGTTCKKVGTETVNGRVTNKWEFMENHKLKKTVWIDQATYIPIKTVERNGTVVQFSNIKEGSQPPTLFELPSGYQKMDMGNMMKMPTPPE